MPVPSDLQIAAEHPEGGLVSRSDAYGAVAAAGAQIAVTVPVLA
jgi:hypothetical protein